MLTKGPHGLGKVVPSASRDRERSRRRARSTQAPADAAPDVTSEVGFWTANYAERLRSITGYIGEIGHRQGDGIHGRCSTAPNRRASGRFRRRVRLAGTTEESSACSA